LLNRILTENHRRRIAVIENEFGEIGIDQALVIDADEEVHPVATPSCPLRPFPRRPAQGGLRFVGFFFLFFGPR
jgi:hypothetical protein